MCLVEHNDGTPCDQFDNRTGKLATVGGTCSWVHCLETCTWSQKKWIDTALQIDTGVEPFKKLFTNEKMNRTIGTNNLCPSSNLHFAIRTGALAWKNINLSRWFQKAVNTKVRNALTTVGGETRRPGVRYAQVYKRNIHDIKIRNDVRFMTPQQTMHFSFTNRRYDWTTFFWLLREVQKRWFRNKTCWFEDTIIQNRN